VVVVVGAEVVGVVVPPLVAGVELVVGVVDVEVEVEEDGANVVSDPVEAPADELAPGCSLATTTAISAVAPAAVSAAARVRRRMRTSARWRASGEL
jgi:hypothetical protein